MRHDHATHDPAANLCIRATQSPSQPRATAASRRAPPSHPLTTLATTNHDLMPGNFIRCLLEYVGVAYTDSAGDDYGPTGFGSAGTKELLALKQADPGDAATKALFMVSATAASASASLSPAQGGHG